MMNQPVWASVDMDQAAQKAIDEARSKKQSMYDQAKHFNPNAVFDDYTDHPDQTKYYHGVTQKQTDQLDQDAAKAIQDETGQVVSEAMKQRPAYVIHREDQDVSSALLIQREADNIINGVTNQYIDCKPKQDCKTTYQKKWCTEIPQAIFQSCHKKLVVDIIPHETVTHYLLTATLSVQDHNYAGISIDAVTGRIDFKGPHDARFNLIGRIPNQIDCHTLQGKVVSNTGNAKLDYINFPSCANNRSLDFHISNGHQKNLVIDMISTVVTYEMKDRWVDDCGALSNESSCSLQKKQCDIEHDTKVIQGVSVTRDCWQESFNYICRGGHGDGTCKPLQAENCEQIGSDCQSEENGQCALYKQTYRCPIQSCSPTTGVICGDGKFYCLDGSCADKNYQPSQDFGKAVSSLSATADAAKQLDQSSLTVFNGHPVECSEKPVGYSNCCTESGWGQDVGLDHCPESAKKLHADREKKLAIQVGRYCSGPEPFPCLEHSQVFCVFGSKLAKIVQEQGRHGQLNMNFGHAKEPNCRGITPEQLQSINMEKINFQDFMDEAVNRLSKPDLKQIQDKIKQHVQDANQGKGND